MVNKNEETGKNSWYVTVGFYCIYSYKVLFTAQKCSYAQV